MINTKYLPDLYYFNDQEDFNAKKAILTVAEYVGGLCNYYYVKTIPFAKEKKSEIKKGKLPDSKEEKNKFISEIASWVIDESGSDQLFILYFDINPLDHDPARSDNSYCPKFCHHDDTCCWDISLTDSEYINFKRKLIVNNLPENLFYKEGQGVCLEYSSPNLIKNYIGKFLHLQTCYTPMQLKEKNEKDNR